MIGDSLKSIMTVALKPAYSKWLWESLKLVAGGVFAAWIAIQVSIENTKQELAAFKSEIALMREKLNSINATQHTMAIDLKGLNDKITIHEVEALKREIRRLEKNSASMESQP